jgi:predicted transcriptional regulator
VSSGEKSPTSRPDLYVLARMIETLKERGPMNRTALATSSGIAYDRMSKYLQWMAEKEFMSISEDGIVSLTEEGVKVYDELVSWILLHVGKLRFPKLSQS